MTRATKVEEDEATATKSSPIANICETCPSYTTAPEFIPAITDQLADVHTLRDDAHDRGWASQAARHDRDIDSLQGHLRRLQPNPKQRPHH